MFPGRQSSVCLEPEIFMSITTGKPDNFSSDFFLIFKNLFLLFFVVILYISYSLLVDTVGRVKVLHKQDDSGSKHS